jgi:hypothetical protein
MGGPEPPSWFAGDLDDPWVAAIAAALSPDTIRIPCPGDLPESWPKGGPTTTLVLHRPILSLRDAESLRRLRSREGNAPRIVLCVGPHARYHHLERWSSLVDVVLPEATARETVARHVGARPRPSGPRPTVVVVSGLHEIRCTLADACRAAGYRVAPARVWSEATTGSLVVWDVPVLEPGWPRLLESLAAARAVVALLGFADRPTVDLARARGAAACLDLPCHPDDLTFVLDRLAPRPARPGARRLAEPAHVLPPAPTAPRPSKGNIPGAGEVSAKGVVGDPGRSS